MMSSRMEDLEQTPMTYDEKVEKEFGVIQTISDVGLSPVRIGILPVRVGIKSIRFMKDRIKELEERLSGAGHWL